jgi:hypothetical protein
MYVSHVASNDVMTMDDELERTGKEMVVAYICLKGLCLLAEIRVAVLPNRKLVC